MISELVHMAKHGEALWRYTYLVSGVLCITMEQVLKLLGLFVGSLAIILMVCDPTQHNNAIFIAHLDRWHYVF